MLLSTHKVFDLNSDSCQGCMTAALYLLWSKERQILLYLDEWLLCAPTRRQTLYNSRLLLKHVQELGLMVNEALRCLIPAQCIIYIGMTLDSHAMSAKLSDARVDIILQLLAHFRLGKNLPYGALLQILGMLSTATSMIPLGLLHLKLLQQWNSLRLNTTRHHRLTVASHCCIQALTQWTH